MLLSEIVSSYMERQQAGIVLGEQEIERNLRNAVRFYCGHAELTNLPPVLVTSGGDGIHSPFDASNSNDGDQDVDLTPSEWALIKPLFDLYIERENAMHLEASRALGVDVYGRSSSEIANDITQIESMIPLRAFSCMPETI